MKKILFYILIFISLATAGCASKSVFGSCSVPNIDTDAQSDKDYGIVYFIRENKAYHAAASFNILEEDQIIGFLVSGNYFIHKAKVGKHTYWSKGINKSYITLDIENGKSYYVIGEVTLGIFPGLSLEVVYEEYAKKLLNNVECYKNIEELYEQYNTTKED